jgi:hypothetical protein
MAGAAAIASCTDPVHDDAVSALGPEDPNVPVGPLHRPGQPCLACHGQGGPASLLMSLGGTVYEVRGQHTPAAGAYVQAEDVAGNYWTVQTNAAGNFFVEAAHFTPTYPIRMTVYSSDLSTSQQMQTAASRDGSCADCHTATAGPRSTGPVYLNLVLDDGGSTP